MHCFFLEQNKMSLCKYFLTIKRRAPQIQTRTTYSVQLLPQSLSITKSQTISKNYKNLLPNSTTGFSCCVAVNAAAAVKIPRNILGSCKIKKKLNLYNFAKFLSINVLGDLMALTPPCRYGSLFFYCLSLVLCLPLRSI